MGFRGEEKNFLACLPGFGSTIERHTGKLLEQAWVAGDGHIKTKAVRKSKKSVKVRSSRCRSP